MNILEIRSSVARLFSRIVMRRRKKAFFVRIVVLAILIPVAGFSASMREFQSPDLTGPYSVGTRYFYLTDESRPDDYTPEVGDHRNISLQIWYPAVPKPGDKPKSFGSIEAAERFVAQGVLDSAFVQKVTMSPSNSYLNAGVAMGKGTYPVILFSASGVMDANRLLSEDLASHGYVVVCIGHPYWCEYYFDDDGSVIFFDKENEFYKKMWEEERSDIVNQTKERITRATTAQEKRSLSRTLNENMQVEIRDVRLWAEDIGFVIDTLEEMNAPGGLFDETLDLGKVGVTGYSKGGVAAGQACLVDERCKAGLNLGGFMFGDVLENELTVPFMVIESVEPWCKDCVPINDLLFYTSKNDIYMVQIHDATHANFTDLTMTKEFLSSDLQSILGPIDGRKFFAIMRDYVLQFFNKHLKGMDAPLLDEPSREYPEVILKSRRP